MHNLLNLMSLILRIERTPYHYREFKHSRLATFVDKHLHSPMSRILLTGLTSIGVIYLGCCLHDARGGDGRLNVLGIAIMILGGIWFYLGGLVIPKLADRYDWAGKIAEWERHRKQDPWGHSGQ